MTTNGSPSHYLKLSEKVTQTESFISTEVVFDPKSMFGKKKTKQRGNPDGYPHTPILIKKACDCPRDLPKKKETPTPPQKKHETNYNNHVQVNTNCQVVLITHKTIPSEQLWYSVCCSVWETPPIVLIFCSTQISWENKTKPKHTRNAFGPPFLDCNSFL